MFDRFTSKFSGVKSKRYKLGDRLPVKTASALLAGQRYKHCIDQIEYFSDLPSEHFDTFYLSTIQRFAEFVQGIPEGPLEPLGSLLTQGLLRGINTLHYFVTHFDKPTPLERFALFSACLLREIGKVVSQQKVHLTNEGGATVKVWQPFCGPLVEENEAESYKFFPMANIYQDMDKSLCVLLARQVIGENGFLCIASDLRLFKEWLEVLLGEEEEGVGRLIKVIKAYRRSGGALIDGLPLIDIEILDSPETEYADKFYEWLIEGLRDESIKVNTSDSKVHLTEAGLFIEAPAIFKDFVKLYNVPVNQFVVFAQFGNLMGIARKGGHDYQHAQLFSNYPEQKGSFMATSQKGQVREGVLMADAKGLYGDKKVPASSPHIKIPASIKASHQRLQEFNATMNPNITLKNK